MASPQVIAMAIVNTLPGCEAQRFAIEGNTVFSGRVMGWGPSLHRIGMAWSAVPTTSDETGIAQAFEPYMAVQRRRIALARSLGLDVDRQPAADDLAHLVTDRVLLEWNRDIPKDVPPRLAKLITTSKPGRDTVLQKGNLVIAEANALDGDDDADPRPRLLYKGATAWGEFDGRMVIVEQRIPDSVLPSLEGKRVGELIELSRDETGLAGLAGRIIATAEMTQGSICLRTHPDWVALDTKLKGDGK